MDYRQTANSKILDIFLLFFATCLTFNLIALTITCIPISVKTHNLSSLHTILSTGSPLKPASFDYVYSSIKKDVLLGSISGNVR